ncbi:MAG: MerR family transcriptional regulator [Chloroflexi bacterium]|nr:MerR family transcriptional regulator [Chloroflexota bacterium]
MRESRAKLPETACFVISVAARMLNVHPQTLRYYERAGLIAPSRSKGNIRLYSPEDIQRAMHIKRLIEDLGVNLAGVEVIMRLTDRLREQEREIGELRRELEQARAELARLRTAPRDAQ